MRLSRREGLVYDKIRSDMLSKNYSRLESMGAEIYIGEYNTDTFSDRFKHSLLNFTKKLPYENCVIYNRGKIYAIRGNEERVCFSNVDDDFLKRSITMHNHPEKNSGMSSPDILGHIDSRIGTSVVVDKNGNKYFLQTDDSLTKSSAKELLIGVEKDYYGPNKRICHINNIRHSVMQEMARLDDKIKYFAMLACSDRYAAATPKENSLSTPVQRAFF